MGVRERDLMHLGDASGRKTVHPGHHPALEGCSGFGSPTSTASTHKESSQNSDHIFVARKPDEYLDTGN